MSLLVSPDQFGHINWHHYSLVDRVPHQKREQSGDAACHQYVLFGGPEYTAPLSM
jgi:hypothetical protein